ncbi:MAG: cupin domain-containing protein [Vicingaceae bacterium]
MNKLTLFKDLLGSYSVETFLKKNWGKTWLHLDRQYAPCANSPLSIELLDNYFTNARLRYPWVKLVKQGSEIPLKEYRNEKLSKVTELIDNDKLFGFLDQGASLVSNSIDKSFGPIGLYCRALEKELSVKVWANLYVSPPKSRGFGIHQDTHDVMVIQLAGTKNWHIYPREENHGPRKPGPDDIPEAEFQLKENELLYLPKNYPHMAFATDDSPSVHLSLGLEGLFWSDLVNQFAKKVNQDPDFSQRIPIPLEGEKAYQQFKECFYSKWKDWNEKLNPTELLNELNTAVNHQTNAQMEGRVSDWLGLNEIDENSYLKKRAYVAHSLENQGKEVILRFQNKKLNFPFFIAPLLEALLKEEAFQLKKIAVEQTEKERIAVAKMLIKKGILTIHKD